MTRVASPVPQDLPTGARALRALVLTTMAERDAALAERDRLQVEHDALLTRNERLHHQLLKLQRAQFGRKSERLPDEQLQLGVGLGQRHIAEFVDHQELVAGKLALQPQHSLLVARLDQLQPETGVPALGLQPDPAHRRRTLWHLRQRHDLAHWQGRPIPVLRLRRPHPEGRDTLPGLRDQHGHPRQRRVGSPRRPPAHVGKSGCCAASLPRPFRCSSSQTRS